MGCRGNKNDTSSGLLNLVSRALPAVEVSREEGEWKTLGEPSRAKGLLGQKVISRLSGLAGEAPHFWDWWDHRFSESQNRAWRFEKWESVCQKQRLRTYAKTRPAELEASYIIHHQVNDTERCKNNSCQSQKLQIHCSWSWKTMCPSVLLPHDPLIALSHLLKMRGLISK